MSMKQQLGSLWDRVIVIVVLCALGAGAAYFVAVNQPPSYQSRTLIALGPKVTAGSTLSSSTQALYDRSVPSTLAQIATSSSVAKAATEATAVPPSAVAITSAVVNDANAVEITVTGARPDQTRRVAMEVASRSMLRFNQLYPLFRTVNIGPAADGADTAVSPSVAAAAGGLLGLFLGVLVALGLGRRRQRLSVVTAAPARAAG